VRLDHLLSREASLTSRSSQSQVELCFAQARSRDLRDSTGCRLAVTASRLAGFHFSAVGDISSVLLQLHCRYILQLLQYCQGKTREEKQRNGEEMCAWMRGSGNVLYEVTCSEVRCGKAKRSERNEETPGEHKREEDAVDA
jgi:hypothetical protein